MPIHRLICDLTNTPKELRIEHDGDNQVDPAVGLETVTEDCVLEVVRQDSVVPECPDGVEDPHDAGDPKYGACEHQPARGTCAGGHSCRGTPRGL